MAREHFSCESPWYSKMNKILNRRALLFALFFISPLLILMVLAFHHAPYSYHNVRERSLKEMKAVIAVWAQKKYEPLTDQSSTKTTFANIQINGTPLAPEMREAYFEALANFLYAFKDGNIESWKQFRFDGLPGKLTPFGEFQVKFYYGLAKADQPSLPEFLPRDKSFLSLWLAKINTIVRPTISSDKDMDDLFYRFLGEITYGNYYKDYFEGVCAREMIVTHDHYTSHPAPLDKYPFFPFTVGGAGQVDATFPNLGYQYWSNEGPTPSFFTVHPTLTELLSQEGGIDCVSTFMFVKINETGEAAPFLLRHVWNPKAKRWEIAEIVDAHLSSYNRLLRIIAL